MRGTIVDSIAGRYKVQTEKGLYNCAARGIFRLDDHAPLVGDEVDVEPTENGEGVILTISPRTNELERPKLANVQTGFIVSSYLQPKPDFLLIDTLTCNMLYEGIEPVIVFNKSDLAKQSQIESLAEIYKEFRVYSINTIEAMSLDFFKEAIGEGIGVLAGPSGAGKTSIINALTGSDRSVSTISEKLGRGKHTTRNCSLIPLGDDCFLADTPGFQQISALDIESGQLKYYFPEFEQFKRCRFLDCLHKGEAGCVIKEALQELQIPQTRYDSYRKILDDLERRRRY